MWLPIDCVPEDLYICVHDQCSRTVINITTTSYVKAILHSAAIVKIIFHPHKTKNKLYAENGTPENRQTKSKEKKSISWSVFSNPLFLSGLPFSVDPHQRWQGLPTLWTSLFHIFMVVKYYVHNVLRGDRDDVQHYLYNLETNEHCMVIGLLPLHLCTHIAYGRQQIHGTAVQASAPHSCYYSMCVIYCNVQNCN